jgi:ribosomal protein S18 acetylase RimI-like enzyme
MAEAAGPVRRAVPADLAALLPLNAEFCAIDGHPFDEALVRRALGPLLADDTHGEVWVLQRDAALLGYAVITWGYSLESGGREALLDEVYVRDRGHGLGGLLVRACLAAAARSGATRTFLETESHNERVRRFYARHGFVEEPSTWMSRDLDPGDAR